MNITFSVPQWFAEKYFSGDIPNRSDYIQELIILGHEQKYNGDAHRDILRELYASKEEIKRLQNTLNSQSRTKEFSIENMQPLEITFWKDMLALLKRKERDTDIGKNNNFMFPNHGVIKRYRDLSGKKLNFLEFSSILDRLKASPSFMGEGENSE